MTVGEYYGAWFMRYAYRSEASVEFIHRKTDFVFAPPVWLVNLCSVSSSRSHRRIIGAWVSALAAAPQQDRVLTDFVYATTAVNTVWGSMWNVIRAIAAANRQRRRETRLAAGTQPPIGAPPARP